MSRAFAAVALAAAALITTPVPASAAGSGTAGAFEAGLRTLVSKAGGSSPAAVHRAKAALITGSLSDEINGIATARVITDLDCVSVHVQKARDTKKRGTITKLTTAAERCRGDLAQLATGGLAGDLRLVKSRLAAIAAKARAGKAFGQKATALRTLQSSIVAKRFSGQTLHGVPFAQVYDDLECVDVKIEAGRASGATSCAKRLLRRASSLAPAKEPLTFGSDLTATPQALPATFAFDDTEFWTAALTVPADGMVTTFRLKTGNSPVALPLRFSVVRPNDNGTVTVVTTSDPPFQLAARDPGVHTYATAGLNYVCCKARKGDIVTVDNSGTGTPGAYVWFAPLTGSTTFSHTSGGDSQNAGAVWTPLAHPGYETLLQVVMQPD
ncbi:MAG: hypothetical protein JHC95_00540 [Solirubrobacteraceae bacterium]|nr:hypothetical protein [Solirubrobacteraceae bacterium]